MIDPRKPAFDAARKVAGKLTERDVDMLHAALDAIKFWRGPDDPTTTVRKLNNPEPFFNAVRKMTGRLDQVQVDTVNSLLSRASHWPTSWLAYGLATAWHEARMKPIEEWGKGAGKRYGKAGKHGQSQHGRGLVQLTWDENYEWADAALGLDGSLLKDFNRALEPDIASAILVKGMEEGAFRGDINGRHTLARHLPNPTGTLGQFITARDIINGGRDKAGLIANYALRFQSALEAGGWK